MKKEKLARDRDYPATRAEAQRQWRIRNRDYWTEYRRRNSSYTEANQMDQRKRNRLRRSGNGIAEMDELIVEVGVIPGCCRWGRQFLITKRGL